MKQMVFSVYDKAVGAFLPPFFVRALGEAVRSFEQACSDSGHQFAKHASDYTMYKLGEFDDVCGIFTVGDPQRIMSALECARIGDTLEGESASS